MLQCPKCRRIIIDRIATGGYKVRSRMILFEGGTAQAICPSCKHRVNVPLSIGEVPEGPSHPKHYIDVEKTN